MPQEGYYVQVYPGDIAILVIVKFPHTVVRAYQITEICMCLFHWTAVISSNLFPSKMNLSRGNRKKSGGLRSSTEDLRRDDSIVCDRWQRKRGGTAIVEAYA